jgi:pyruvate kinase
MNGMGIGKTSVTGKVCVVRSQQELETKFKPGDILVISNVDEDSAQYASKVAAIVAEEGGLTSNAAIIGISYGMPVLVGMQGVTNSLPDGIIVTVDAARGLLYQGQINAR